MRKRTASRAGVRPASRRLFLVACVAFALGNPFGSLAIYAQPRRELPTDSVCMTSAAADVSRGTDASSSGNGHDADRDAMTARIDALEKTIVDLQKEVQGKTVHSTTGISLKLRGHLLMDGVAFHQNKLDLLRAQEQNALLVPVARVIAEGSGWEVMSYKIEFDYVHQIVGDLYMTIGKLPLLGNVRVGYMKEPFSLEELNSPKIHAVHGPVPGDGSAPVHPSHWCHGV